MKTLRKRLLALLLALGMALSLCAAPAWAAGPEAGEAALSTQSVWWKGTCSENAIWDTDWADDDQTCTMIISGSGEIGNFLDEDGNEITFKDRVVAVDVHPGITSIGYCAFKDGFTGLEKVTIPGTVKTIGEEAFQGCTELTSVSLEEGLEVIEDNAFLGCGLLGSITIPKSVTKIWMGALGYLDAEMVDDLTGEAYVRNDSFTISGYTGSAAEDYALKGGFDFQSLGRVSAPPKTSLSSVKAQKGRKAAVKWKQGKKCGGYELQYSTDKKFKKGIKTVKITDNYTTSKTVKSLKAGKTYYFRIRSVMGSLASGWSAVKSVKAKK